MGFVDVELGLAELGFICSGFLEGKNGVRVLCLTWLGLVGFFDGRNGEAVDCFTWFIDSLDTEDDDDDEVVVDDDDDVVDCWLLRHLSQLYLQAIETEQSQVKHFDPQCPQL